MNSSIPQASYPPLDFYWSIPAQFLSEHLEHAEPDLLRSMLKTFIDALVGAEAVALCGAPYGARSDEQVNFRNG